MKRWVLSIIVFLAWSQAQARTLHEEVKGRLAASNKPREASFSVPSSAIGYVPIESFEIRSGDRILDEDYRDERSVGRSYNRLYNDFTELNHAIRMNFKSVKEIRKTNESLSLTRSLVATHNRANLNQNLYETYQKLIEDVFNSRLKSVLGDRSEQLSNIIDKSSLTLGMSKVNTKILVDHLEQQQKVESEMGAVNARGQPSIDSEKAERLMQTLINNIGGLSKRTSELEPLAPIELQAKQIENQLRRLDQEIGWASDEKFLSFVEIRKENGGSDTAYRLGVNIPWVRFDGVTKARERALMHVREREYDREVADTRNELRLKKSKILSLAAQINTLSSRLDRTRDIQKRIRALKDVELKTVMSDFSFETELNLLLLGYDFYLNYLEYLRDLGSFAEKSDRDLLHAEWKAI